MLALMILVVGVAARWVGHIPNFTPVLALALFGGACLPRRYALIVPLALMMMSDLVLGGHDTLVFTWGSVLLISGIGLRLRSRRSLPMVLGAGLSAAVLFFVITNFGVWLSPLYPTTWEGLAECYTLAVPFFRATLLSTLLYSGVVFGVYEICASRVKGTAREAVWLSTGLEG